MNSDNCNPNEAVYSAQAGPYSIRETLGRYWQVRQSWQLCVALWEEIQANENTLDNSYDDDDDDLDDLPELVDP